MAEILMPQLGETVTEGTITKWFKQIGDPIAMDEILYEVSTDKVDSEVPSTVSGVLAQIVVPEGETVPVGAVLAVVSDSADAAASATSVAAAPAQAAPPLAPAQASSTPPVAGASANAPVGDGAADPALEGSASAGAEDARLLSPIVRRLITDNGLDV
ncbi:MAG: dihydrolipoyllysine-residue succinyltransferase, partial [Acidimicrobiia bacterium]|nr:dihydrolipoyllysine-residue succinyltransferase [Acidimicrobiia bacterium]